MTHKGRSGTFIAIQGGVALTFLVMAVTLAVPGAAEQQNADKWGTITTCRLWKCPGCGTVLEKGALGKLVQPGQPASRIVGTATCGKCGARYTQSDVYGGRYDYDPTAKEQPENAPIPTQVSVVVFAIGSEQGPTQEDARRYCSKILTDRHPKSSLVNHYVIGFRGNRMTLPEGVALYASLVSEKKLPDLGDHFDSFAGSGPDGKPIVALFFDLAEGARQEIVRTMRHHVDGLKKWAAGKPGYGITEGRWEKLFAEEVLAFASACALSQADAALRDGKHHVRSMTFPGLYVAVSVLPSIDDRKCQQLLPGGYTQVLDGLLKESGWLQSDRDFAHWIYCYEGKDKHKIHLTFIPAKSLSANPNVWVFAKDLMTKSERQRVGIE